MKTLVKDCYIWQWSNETVENLQKNRFNHFSGCFVKRDFIINDDNKILLNFNIENETIDNVINLQNKYCLPGFIDSHLHLSFTADLNCMCNVASCKTAEEIINTLKEYENQKEKQKKEKKETHETSSCEENDFLFATGFIALQDDGNENNEEVNTKKVKTQEVKINRFMLDEHFPEKCVVILSTCVHYAILNTKALERFDLLRYENEDEEMNKNIEYYKNKTEGTDQEDGENEKKILSGVIYEKVAFNVFFQIMNKYFSEKTRTKNIQKEINNMLKTGLTCVQSCDENISGIYKKLESQNNLNIRLFLTEFGTSFYEYLFNHYKIDSTQSSEIACYKKLLEVIEKDEHRENVENQLKIHFGFIDENDNVKSDNNSKIDKLFYANRIKFFCDGSLGGKTCATYYPFLSPGDEETDTKKENQSGDAHMEKKNYGIIMEPLTLSNRVKIAKLLNIRIEFHCIGERSSDFLLNELLQIDKNHDRFIIVHAQLLNENVIKKIKTLNILLSCQPSFLSSDYKYIKNYINTAYTKYCYLYKSLLDQNIVIAGSSDAPVELFAPLIGIFDCMFRNVTKVLPISYIESFYTDHEREQKKQELYKNIKNIKNIISNVFEEKERLSFSEALALYTITPAYLAKAEFFNKTNKIQLGAICDNAEADFVVVDRDISKDSEINLLTCRIFQTWVGGKIRYQNDQMDNQ